MPDTFSLAQRAGYLRQQARHYDESAAIVSLASDKAYLTDMANELRRRADDLEGAH